MSLECRPGRARALVRNRDLLLLLSAGLVSQTGDWMLATGIAYQVYALTGSTLASAGVLLATQGPQAVLGSVAGVLVDRWDRRRVMVLTNLALAVVLLPLAAVGEAGRVWLVYLVVALSSCLAPFFVAAEATMVPALVAPDLLVTANAANAQVRNLARLLGAALGGVVVAAGGLAWLAPADAATFLLAAGLVALVRLRAPRTAAGRTGLLRGWAEGLTAIRRSRVLVVVVVFFTLSGIGEAAMGTLFAPFVHDVLGGSARIFGTIVAVQAVGGIVGGLVVTALGHRVQPRTLFAWGAIVFGALDLVLFLYPLAAATRPAPAWPAMVVIAAVGLPGAAAFAGALTVFQLATTDEVRGRVFGAVTSVENAAMLGSTIVVGALATRAGIVPVIAVQGGVQVLGGALVLLLLRPGATAPERGDPDRCSAPVLGRAQRRDHEREAHGDGVGGSFLCVTEGPPQRPGHHDVVPAAQHLLQLRGREVEQAGAGAGQLVPGGVGIGPALLPVDELGHRALGGVPLQRVGRRAGLGLARRELHRRRGHPPRPRPAVGGVGRLEVAVLRQLAQVVAGERVADAELSGRIGRGERALAPDQAEQLQPYRVRERTERDRVGDRARPDVRLQRHAWHGRRSPAGCQWGSRTVLTVRGGWPGSGDRPRGGRAW